MSVQISDSPFPVLPPSLKSGFRLYISDYFFREVLHSVPPTGSVSTPIVRTCPPYFDPVSTSTYVFIALNVNGPSSIIRFPLSSTPRVSLLPSQFLPSTPTLRLRTIHPRQFVRCLGEVLVEETLVVKEKMKEKEG